MARLVFVVAGFIAASVAVFGIGGSAAAGVPSGDLVFVSSSSSGSVDGISFTSGDILRLDSATDSWTIFFDGSASGIGAANIDGFHIVDATPGDPVIELSLAGPTAVSGLGIVDDSDVLLFANGALSLLFDGSDVGLTAGGEDLDAWTSDGANPVASTVGAVSVPRTGGGTLAATDEDLIGFAGITGNPTNGAFSLSLDGSDLGFRGDWVAAWINPSTDQIYGAGLNGFSAAGLTGDGDDIFVFTGTSGSTTSGTLARYFDGDAHRFGGEQIDGLHIIPGTPPPPGSADLAVTIGNDAGDAAVAGDTVVFTVEVTNNGPDAAANVVVTESVPVGVTVTATSGCSLDPNGLPCSLGDIAAGASASFTMQTTVDSGSFGLVTVSVTAASGTADPNSSDNSAETDVLLSGPPTAVDDGPETNSTPGSQFHVAIDGTLIAAAPGLVENDALGSPAGTVVHFGGGDLGGSVVDYLSGETAPIGTGSLQVNADGSFAFTPDAGQSGPFTFAYRLANDGGFSDAVVVIYVGPRPVAAGGDLIYLSATTDGEVDGILFNDEDVLVYDTATDTWDLFFDGSDVGLELADVNGFAIQTMEPNPTLQMSFAAPISVPGIAGTVDDSDVVTFTASSIGQTTAGSFSLLVDGSDVGLSSGGEDVDAVTWVPADGGADLALSTWGAYNVGGGVAGGDEDLLQFSAIESGAITSGTFAQLFDGSDVGLVGEDVAGASFDPESGDVYISTLGPFAVEGLSGSGSDVIVFTGTTGSGTTGTFSTFFDGAAARFEQNQINAVHVMADRNDGPTAKPDRAATDENTPITIGPDYTTSISSPGGDISKIAIDPRTGNYVVLGSIDGQTQAQLYDPVNRRVLETETLPGVARQPVGVDFHPQKDLVAIVTAGINEAFLYDEDLSTQVKSLALDFQPRSVTVNPMTGEVIIGGVDVTKIYDLNLDELLHTIEHEGLIASGLDIHERTGEIVAVLYEDLGSFGPGQIQWWDADGQLLTTLNSADTNFPVDLSIDQATGDFAVPNADTGDTVTVFDSNGNTSAILGGFNGPRGVAFDPATGNLAVVRSQGWLIDATTGALIDGFFDEWTALAVQPTTEEILAASSAGGFDSGRLAALSPTTRNQSGLARGYIVDVATDPASGRIAVLDGAAVNSRQLEIYDPTGTTLLHSMTVPAASVAFHPDTGAVAVSLRTREFRLYDPTLTTQLASFPLGSSDSLGVQPGTGNIVARFGLSQAKIFDPTGSEIGSITSLVRDVAVDPFTGNIAIAGPNTGTEIWDPTGTTLLDTIPTPLVGDFPVGVAFGGTGNLVIAHDKSGSLDVMARGLLANDADPDGDPLTVTGFDATSASGATVTVNPDGSFTYDPTGVAAIAALRSGETLADTFTYTIDDGNGETDAATATVFVAGVNDGPQLSSSSSSYAENLTDPIEIGPASDDSDSPGNGLTYSLIGAEDDDLFSIDPVNGDLSFLTPPDFENPLDADTDNQYRVSVGVSDSEGSSAAAYVSITVTDVADTGSITIVQDTDPDDGQLFSYVLSPVVGGVSGFTLDDDGDNGNGQSNTRTLSDLPADTYTVTQTATAGWGVADITCVGGTTSEDETTRTATIALAGGDDVICTFTNQRASDVSVSLSATPDPVLAGGTLTYLLGFSAAGFPAGDPVLTLDLPAGVTYVGAGSFDSLCSEATPGVVTCDLNGLWAGLNAGFEVTVGVGTVGPLTATGSVTFTGIVDPNLSNNSVTINTAVTSP